MNCPNCGSETTADFVDVGVGVPMQAGPYHCLCGWVENGCMAEECSGEQCKSWEYCQGKSLGG